MSETAQELLQRAWWECRDGCMNAMTQARAWALRELWNADEKPKYGMLPWVAGKFEKQGGGAPSKQAIEQLFHKIDTDEDWFP
eukprot:321212-Karenia_brevis.AAC.1